MSTFITKNFTPIGETMSYIEVLAVIHADAREKRASTDELNLSAIMDAQRVCRKANDEKRVWVNRNHKLAGDVFEQPHVMSLPSTFRNLWSWLCGGFYIDGKVDTRPIVTPTGLEPYKASVNYIVVDGVDVDQSVQSTLHSKMNGPLKTMEEYRDYCRQVMVLDDTVETAVIYFPEDDVCSIAVSAHCDFTTGRVVFSTNPLFKMI